MSIRRRARRYAQSVAESPESFDEMARRYGFTFDELRAFLMTLGHAMLER